jgi:DNA polymerase-3 subunit epsilon
MSHEDIDSLFTVLKIKHFVAFDFETTGLSPQADRVVEIGAIRFRMIEAAGDWSPAIEAEYQSLIHPGRAIPADVSAIHGICDLDVAMAPYFGQAAGNFLPLLDEAILVAHNAPFDMGFLLAEAARAGLPAPANPAYDTRNLAKAAVPGLPSYSLGNLAVSFGITQKTAHRGADDARVCMELFTRCVNLLARR